MKILVVILAVFIVLLDTSGTLAQIQIAPISPPDDLENMPIVLPNSTISMPSEGEVGIGPITPPSDEIQISFPLRVPTPSVSGGVIVREFQQQTYQINVKDGRPLTADDLRSQGFRLQIAPGSEMVSTPLYPKKQAEDISSANPSDQLEGEPPLSGEQEKGSGGAVPDSNYGKVKEIMDTVDKSELMTENGKSFYAVEGTKRGALLGLIPLALEIRARIDAATGELSGIQRPWWSFLVVWGSNG